MKNYQGSTINHEQIYRFFSDSEGVWSSQIGKVTIELIDKEKCLAIAKNYKLLKIDFGVKVTWKYNTNTDVEYLMNACTDSQQPNLLFCQFGSKFTDKEIVNYDLSQILDEVNSDSQNLIITNSFIVCDYVFLNPNILIIQSGKYKATTFLENNKKRCRQEVFDGHVIRRIWEEKL